MLIKLLKVTLLALVLTACGHPLHVIEGDPDPDTLNGIRTHNTQILEGNWILDVTPTRKIQLNFQGGQYQVSASEKGKAFIYDEGRIEHRAPGKIHLVSERIDCRDSADRVVLTFGSNEKDTFYMTGKGRDAGVFKRTDLAIQRSTARCLFE